METYKMEMPKEVVAAMQVIWNGIVEREGSSEQCKVEFEGSYITVTCESLTSLFTLGIVFGQEVEKY